MFAEYQSSPRYAPVGRTILRPRRPRQGPPAPRSNRRWGWSFLIGLTVALGAWLLYRSLGRPAWTAALPGLVGELLVVTEVAGIATLICLWSVLAWRELRGGGLQPSSARAAPPALSVAEMYALSPAEFEDYVARLFAYKGYQVGLKGRSGDQGVDLLVSDRQGRQAIVQCKRYQSTVGADVVRELYGTFIHEGVAHAFLVTTAEISDAARQWARGKPLTLIDGVLLARIGAALQEGA